MARIRSIKPEFWISDQVTECSIPARLMFVGLWTFCDDGGRMPCSPKRIKKQIFPGDQLTLDDISQMLDELSSNALGNPMVSRYRVDGNEYLQITGWEKHQRIDRPRYQFPDQNGVIPVNKGDFQKRFDEASTQESSRVDKRSRVERSRVEKEKGKKERARARASTPPLDQDFSKYGNGQASEAQPELLGTNVPQDWQPSAAERADAVAAGLSADEIEHEIAVFVAKRPAMMWRMWVLRAVSYAKRNSGGRGIRKQSSLQDMARELNIVDEAAQSRGIALGAGEASEICETIAKSGEDITPEIVGHAMDAIIAKRH